MKQKDDENLFYNIDGFNSIFSNRAGKEGGIAVYIKDTIQFKILKTNMASSEIGRINITDKKDSSFTVLVIYRPLNKSTTLFLIELEQIIANIGNKEKLTLIIYIKIDILKKSITSKYFI